MTQIEMNWLLAGRGGKLDHSAVISETGIHLSLGLDARRTTETELPRGQIVAALVVPGREVGSSRRLTWGEPPGGVWLV